MTSTLNQAFSDHQVLLNVEATSVEIAAAATERFGSCVVVGVMARRFDTPAAGAAFASELHSRGVLVSAGLGDGSADHWQQALEIALESGPAHLNQVFPAAALSQRVLADAGAPTLVNALIEPAADPGLVRIATGPRSRQHAGGDVPIDVALDLLCETGVRSVKLYPVRGIDRLDSIRAVSAAAAARDMVFEPTGGIAPDNLAAVLDTALTAGVQAVMPHLYGSVKDPATAELDQQRLARAFRVIDEVLGRSVTR